MPDGLYDFRTVATDAGGNTESAPTPVTNRRIDNTAPSATMLSPGNPVHGSVTLASNTSDAGSGIASVSYEIAPNGGSFSSQPALWDTTGVIDGLYDLHVTVTDVAGNSTTSSLITTRVDNTPPSLTFSSPAAGAVVSGIVPLVASSSDASPASPPVSFEYKLHSDATWTATPASWNTTALPAGDGLYDLRATATDDAGNTTRVVNANILVDSVPPSVTITAPPASINGSFPSPTTFSADATDSGSGVASVEFFECSNTSVDCATGTFNSLGVDTTAPYGVSWNVPSDGNHALEAVATDNAGHPASTVVNVSVDSTPPDTGFTGVPADPSSAPATFTFASTEPNSTFECRIDVGPWNGCTSPHTFTGLTDGPHTVDVRATDQAGNTDPTPDSWTWHRDTTHPSGALDDPGRNVRGLVTLTSSSNDPTSNGYASGVGSVSYQYSADGTTWATIGTLTSAPFDTLNWNTVGIADGVYQLRIVVTDVAGNVTGSTPVANVRIDNTPPTTSQDDPGAYLRLTKTLTGSAADSGGSGIDHVDFQRAPTSGGPWTTIGTATSAPYSTSFDTLGVTDGHYDFRTVAVDVAGNQAISLPVTDRLVDNTPPTGTMNDPSTAGGFVRGTISLTSVTDDPNGSDGSGVASIAYEYSTDGGATWTNTGSTLNTTALPDGGLKLHVVVTDRAGNTATSAAVDDTIDNTKPVTTDDAPAGWQASDVTVNLTANDAGSGVNVTEYSVDGGAYTVGTSVTIPAPPDGSNDGVHTIAYFSADHVGNIEQVKSATVLIDATPPACPSCTAADYLRGTVTLSASPSDGGAGIKSVAFQYTDHGGSTWTTIGTDTTGPAPYTTAWDTTAVPDGHYDLQILVTDNADNTTITSLPDKVVDNTAPNVALVGAPTEGAVVTGNVGISASAADATSPIASVEFFVRGSSINTDTTAPYTTSWDSTSGPDGTATIVVVVTDMAGNSTTSPVRTITVDNRSLVPTLDDPGQYLRGVVTLTASSDPDTVSVDFQRAPAGSGTWSTITTDTSAPFSASLDTSTLTDGLYDFRVVATDGTGNTGTSAVRANRRVDNTPPTGALTAPAPGATVGGTNVHLAASTADGAAGSGVASVTYEMRPTGGGSFTTISSSTTAPFDGTWNTTGLATGDYDLRPLIADQAGNTFTGGTVTVHVDATAPTVVLSNPGSPLANTVTLNATVTGNGATQVAFSVSPAGANAWTPIGTDTAAPWSQAFDTTSVPDGLYDLRAVVSDSLGNTSQDTRPNIRIDNTAPILLSSTPADGSTVASANSIELVASEPTTPTNVTLDGSGTVAPVISGTHILYNTGPLSLGLHTLAGRLTDPSGKWSPFRVSFTVWSQSSAQNSNGTAPPIEGNTRPNAPTSLTSADGFATVTVPAGAWGPNGNDWIVIRIQTTAPPSLANGYAPASEVVDVTAFWALSRQPVHHFDKPIEILLRTSGKGLVPATFESAAWRGLRRMPSEDLPAGWEDGFTASADSFVLRTLHLSQFTVLRDVQAPSAPANVLGFLIGGHLTLTWTPGADNSGTYDYVRVLANGAVVGDFGVDRTSGDAGPWTAHDSRSFTLRETDVAGNNSQMTDPLRRVPPLVGKTLDGVQSALSAAGLKLGQVSQGGVGRPGTVTAPTNFVLAEQGTAIDVTVAPGGTGFTKLVFQVVSPRKFKPAQKKTLAARIVLTRKAHVTAVLYNPQKLKLSTWRFALKAGRSIVKLSIPSQVQRPGMYSIRWTAVAGHDTATRTIKVRIFSGKNPTRPVQVVLAGSAVSPKLALGSGKPPKVVKTVGEDSAFDAVGAGSNGVQVMVVDVDQFGTRFIRDLHTVFPSLKIVALSRSPKTLAKSLKAGATIALPSSVPNSVLAAVISRLLKKG
ncbi:MAG: hypothetical protein E6G32_12085 [Actinobacteria bacterium]|nr:MAG: hypothetical protein E6G32_12085 [Actinomycetota bacterium]